MTNSVSPSTFDVAAVLGSAEGAIDGFDYVDGLPGLVGHPRARRVPAGAPLIVTGWALDRRRRGAATAVVVVLDRTRPYAAQTGFSRYDVTASLSEPARDERIGFRAIIPTDVLPAGGHEIRAYALLDDGAWYDAGRYGFSVYEPVRPGLEPSARAVRVHVDQVVDLDATGGIVAFDGAVPLGRYAMLTGWAFDRTLNTGPASVYATDDRGNRWSAPCEIARPDIKAAMGTADERLGFELLIPARALGRGRHAVHIGAADHDGRPTGTPIEATLDVAAELRAFPWFATELECESAAAARLTVEPADGDDGSTSALTGENVIDVPRGAPVTVDGWALTSAGLPATGVYVELSLPGVGDNPHRHPAIAGFRRDDSPRRLTAPPVADAWFSCRLGTEALPARRHRLDLLVAESGQRLVARRTLGYVNVLPPARKR
ncbi:MAG: hypothetical protein JWM87_3165 [Candidatus Eremiobacteraeota bacterium]|nr:hypothetical protein [Candidatus Eremiobacteraeota bacterium]